MAENGLADMDRAKIVAWAAKHYSIEKVYLFGSRARGDHGPNSDIDLAIQMDLHDWFDWYPKAGDLQLSHRVDLEWYDPGAVDLEAVGKAVKQDGSLLYERSRSRSDQTWSAVSRQVWTNVLSVPKCAVRL
jgi:predicted nucleotidyltransferase